MHHPDHDAVATEVASWYTTSAPAMGYLLEQRGCGLFTTSESVLGPRVILRVPDAAALQEALEEIRSVYGDSDEVEIWVEGRPAVDQLQPRTGVGRMPTACAHRLSGTGG